MKSRIALAMACAALTACGGGGDPPPGVALTAANYIAATREAISPTSYLSDTASLPMIVGAKVGGANAIFKFSRAQLAKVAGRFSSASAQASGVTQTEVEYCENGQPPSLEGTLSITTNDVNGNGAVDPGDSATVVATNCLFDGALLNGEMQLVIDSLTGEVDVPPFAFTAGFTLNNLEAQYGGVTERGNGSFSLGVDVPSFIQRTVSMNAPSLAMSVTDGGTPRTKTLKNYAVWESFDAGTTTITVGGRVNTSLLQSNELTATTVVPFVAMNAAICFCISSVAAGEVAGLRREA